MPCSELSNSFSQLCRILSNTGCGVGDRSADHLQHFGGGRLLLQRLLGLVEQPRVLDRDHGLVGEGRAAADLLLVEGPASVTRDADRADRPAFPQHRGEQRSRTPHRAAPASRSPSGTPASSSCRRMCHDAPRRGRVAQCGAGEGQREGALAAASASPAGGRRQREQRRRRRAHAPRSRRRRTGARSCERWHRTPAAVSATASC